MKVLLVGGNGFIGSHIQDVLLRRGHSGRVLDASPERYRPALPEVDHRVGSSADPSALSESLVGIDSVVYLASTTVPSTSNADVSWDIKSNLIPLVATLDAMRRTGVEHIVFLSSGGTVYGVAGDTPVQEAAPLDPVCSYGVVKVASENYLGMYRHLYGLRPLALRPSNPFGPRQGHAGVQGFISTSLMRLRRDEPIEIWGDGSVVRDYLYVEDLALAAVLGIETSAVGAVNIGSGVGRSLSQVIATLSAVTGTPARIEYHPGRAFDVPHLVLSIERARETLGWTPTTPFDEGIAAHWHWLSGVHD
jgi:UDP-glucose 4-epimerase